MSATEYKGKRSNSASDLDGSGSDTNEQKKEKLKEELRGLKVEMKEAQERAKELSEKAEEKGKEWLKVRKDSNSDDDDKQIAMDAYESAKKERDAAQAYIASIQTHIDTYTSELKALELRAAQGQGQGSGSAADELLTAFWRNLKDANVSAAGKVLTLKNSYVMGIENVSRKKLYIRECYSALLKIIEDKRTTNIAQEKGSTIRVTILGTPGIGKTWMLYWLLWKLRIREDVPVVVILHTESHAYKFTSDGNVFESTSVDTFDSDLKRYDCWYLVDGIKPNFDCRGVTILASSPDRAIWSKFDKEACNSMQLYMPVFTRTEIDECRAACFSDQAAEDVATRYAKIGGVVRFVLEKYEGLDRKIADACSRANVQNCMTAISSDTGKEKVTHLIIHYDVITEGPDAFTKASMIPASHYAACELDKRFKESQEIEYLRFLRRDIPNAETMRGKMFEAHAHRILEKGGEFSVRELSSSEEMTWKLPSHEREIFHSASEGATAVAKDHFAVPDYGQFPTFDAFMPTANVYVRDGDGATELISSEAGTVAIQDTISKSGHPLKAPGFDSAINACVDAGIPIKCVVFPVPHKIFDEPSYCWKREQKETRNLPQYVLRIDLGEEPDVSMSMNGSGGRGRNRSHSYSSSNTSKKSPSSSPSSSTGSGPGPSSKKQKSES